nr:MAG TPA: hypothetical protein [Caudoviricetes sp.]
MVIYRAYIHTIKCSHHFLCEPYIFVLISHFNTILLFSDRSNIS